LEFYLKSDKKRVGIRGSITYSWGYRNSSGFESNDSNFEDVFNLPEFKNNPTIITYIITRNKIIELCRISLFPNTISQAPSYFAPFVYSCNKRFTKLIFIGFHDFKYVYVTFEIAGIRLEPVEFFIDITVAKKNETKETDNLKGDRYQFEPEYVLNLNKNLLKKGWTVTGSFVCERFLFNCVQNNNISKTIQFKGSEIFLAENQLKIRSPNHTIIGHTVGIILQRKHEERTAARLVIPHEMISIDRCTEEGIYLIARREIPYIYRIYLLEQYEIVDLLLSCLPDTLSCSSHSSLPVFSGGTYTFLQFRKNFNQNFQFVIVIYPQNRDAKILFEDRIVHF
ncbi:hypothetical protein HZS_6385, partial [Henneguya salminicola]